MINIEFKYTQALGKFARKNENTCRQELNFILVRIYKERCKFLLFLIWKQFLFNGDLAGIHLS